MKNMLEEYLDVIQRASTGFEKLLFYNFAQNVMDYYNMGKTEGYKQGKADGQVEGYAEGYAASQATLPPIRQAQRLLLPRAKKQSL